MVSTVGLTFSAAQAQGQVWAPSAGLWTLKQMGLWLCEKTCFSREICLGAAEGPQLMIRGLKPTGSRLPLPLAGWLLPPQVGAGQHWAADPEVLHGWQLALCGMEASFLFPWVRDREKASWAGYSWELFPKSGQDVHAPSQAEINNH